MILEWSNVSKADMRAANEYIKARNPRAARKNMRQITSAAGGLKDTPKRGTKWKIKNTYKLVVASTNFTIFYKLYEDDGLVRVLRVMHQSQQVPVYIDDDGWSFDLFN